MKYKVLNIVKVSDNYYDVDYKEIRWFRLGITYRGVRTECSSILGVIVSTGICIHNFRQILKAYDFSSVDFTQRKEPLPIVYTIVGKAIY